MKSSIKTPEFWAALVGQITGIAVLLGALTAEQGEGLSQAVQAIVGGILSLGTILGFIKAQGARKTLAVQLASAKIVAAQRGEAGAAAASATDELLRQI